MKYKKILFTIPTLKMGGMERAVVNFASELLVQGYDVGIFLLSDNKVFFDINSNISIYFGKKTYDKKILDLPSFFISLFKLRHLCRKFRPDLVFSFSGRHSSYVISALYLLKCKVYTFHRSSPLIEYGFIDNLLRKITYPISEGMVVQTHFAKEIFIKKYKLKKIFVVPNPVREIVSQEPINKEKAIITVGRLVKGKRIDMLIDFFYNANNDEWKFYIIGDGKERVFLKNKVASMGLESKIIFVGSTNDVDHYLNKSSVFMFASQSEGFPNALLEAMCSGLACISYNCVSGPSEIIIDGINGYLIEMDDQTDFQNKLNCLLEDEKLRQKFSKEALKLKDKFSSKRIINEFISNL